MSNTKSAKKMDRKIKKNTVVNKARKNRIRSFIKKLKETIMLGNKGLAQEAFKKAQLEVHKGVTKGVITLKKASRIVSKLSANVKAM
ncbi:MAG: 30S ribosomal protein S20 [Rickettsiaceae bacterium H1]|nr:30S ribosomal protein S20 [Rickettsiaceae bacterium H1]